MTVLLDQGRDTNGQHLVALLNTVGADGAKLFAPPDFVKAASSEVIVAGEDTTPGLFADPRHRMFPCHTGAATWVSAAYFHSQKQAASKEVAQAIERRIDAAAKHHGITSFVTAVKTAVEGARARTETELPDSDFALVVAYEDGNKERHLPIRNPGELKVACDYLRQYYNEFTFDDRRAIAEKILTKAAALNVGLGVEQEALEKQAGHGSCAPETVANLVFSRAKAVRLIRHDLEMAEQLGKMAQDCLDRGSDVIVPSNLHKIAGFIDRVDHEYGFRGLTDLPKPEDVLFQINVKVASRLMQDHVSLTSGNVYAKQALAGVNLADIRSIMGDGFAGAVSDDGLYLDTEKLAQVAPTMPRDDAELFDSLMRQLNVQPVYKEAAHHASGPLSSASNLLKLAGMHV
jgi:hypothetical protein